MTRTLGGTLVLLALLPAVRALDEPKKPPTPAEQVRALEKEFREQQQAFQKAYQEAKTQEERNKVIQEKLPKPGKLAPHFLEIAEKNPKDPAAVDALMWVINHPARAGAAGTDNPRPKALELLRKDHIKSEKLAAVCNSLAFTNDPASASFLRAASEKSPHHDVQGAATFALAMNLKTQVEAIERLKENPQWAAFYEQTLGKAGLEGLKKQDPAKLAKEEEDLFQRVIDKYGDLKDMRQRKLGTLAENELFAIRHLGIGKVAPEIEGEDVDGKKFKLSDYKGKVVVLDFWGNW